MPKITDLTQVKKALIDLVEKLEGLPKERRERLIKALTHKDTIIPDKDTAREISTFITLIFCTGKVPRLSAKNKALLQKFTEQNLQIAKSDGSPSHSRKK